MLLCPTYDGEESLRFLLVSMPPKSIPDNITSLKKDVFEPAHRLGTFNLLSFDFDHVPLVQAADVLNELVKTLGINVTQVGAVHTGNGLHIHIPVTDTLTVEEYTHIQMLFYTKVYNKIAKKLQLKEEQKDPNGLRTWNKMGRVPFTHNTKKIDGKFVTTKVYPLNVPQAPEHSWSKLFSLLLGTEINVHHINQAKKIADTKDQEHFNREDWKKTPLFECEAIHHCIKHPQDVSEPLWFDMMRILNHDPHGRKLIHAISERHKDYDPDETDRKYETAKNYSSPACNYMHQTHAKCELCKHYQSKYIRNPAELLAKTKWDSMIGIGFKKVTAKGHVTDVLNVNMLGAYLCDLLGTRLRSSQDRVYVYIYNENVWERISSEELMSVFVLPVTGIIIQGVKTIRQSLYEGLCLQSPKLTIDQEEGVDGLFYFKNGIYDLKSKKWTKHSQETSSTYVLNFDYDPEGSTVEGRQILNNYLRGLLYCKGEDEEVGDGRALVLQEHIGSIFSGRKPDGNSRCLFIYGTSDNGKSKFFRIVRRFLGAGQVVNFSIKKLNEGIIFELSNRLLGLSSDYSVAYDKYRMTDDEDFKNMVTGDPVTGRELYHPPITTVVRAKLVILSNHLITSVDKSQGFYKRFSFLRFPHTFIPGGQGDVPDIDDQIFKYAKDAFFSWAIEGYQRLESNKFVYSVGIEAKRLLEAVKINNDPVYQFMQEKIIYQKGDHVLGAEMAYRYFSNWQISQGLVFRITQRNFTTRLKDSLWRKYSQNYQSQDNMYNRFRMNDGSRLYGYNNLTYCN